MQKTILITGASSGIGRATATLFQENGWAVAATMRDPADAGALADLENVLVGRLDLLDPASIDAAVAAAVERFGGLDVLLNNAGYGAYGVLEATPMDVVRRQFEVNLFGLIQATQAALPHLRERGGAVVNVSSVGGRVAYPLGSLYHGSKWAVEGLSEALHFELATVGVRVKVVEPGGVRTDFSGRSFVFTDAPDLGAYRPLVEAFAAARESGAASPTGTQEPREVAEVIWEAAHDATARLRYVSGEGATSLLSGRYDVEQDEAFVGAMRRRFGLQS